MARRSRSGSIVGAQVEDLLDLLERQARDDRAAVRVEGDEAFGLELAERLADRDAAHAQLVGERVLSQRLALDVVAVEDAVADRVERHAGDGLALKRARAQCWSRRAVSAIARRPRLLVGVAELRRARLVGARHRPEFRLRGGSFGYNIHAPSPRTIPSRSAAESR